MMSSHHVPYALGNTGVTLDGIKGRDRVGGATAIYPFIVNGDKCTLVGYLRAISMDNSFAFVMFFGLLLTLGHVVPQAESRAFFVFGDSLVDNGEQLGSEPTLPYLSPELTGQKLLVGANFASAGIGILNDTGIQFINIIRISKQLQYFEQYQQRVSALIGPEQTQRLVNEALVLMTDFVNNYFLVPFSARSRQFALPYYVVYLISEYRKILLRLHELGARRVLVTGTGPLGCVPAELAQHSRAGECEVELQRAAALFNPQLFQMLNGLNAELGSDVFIAANAYQMHMDWISNPRAYGRFYYINGIGLCTTASNLCPNWDIFVFWDPFHPSERANRLIVQQIMTASTKCMNPMNLSTIMALDSKVYQ
ncbi:GDSL esterase/lipase [Hibiscus syriacus]|uniref:GDSL esterase/lipase n=1 Tax=Hibiscus syriacus TaxID=106335 RepID=A0A6A3CQS6_HIBSY|nr:GDSL esterase/lipase [Hibiscus syriacus]